MIMDRRKTLDVCCFCLVYFSSFHGALFVIHFVLDLSFLMLGTGVEEVLEGSQIFLPCFIGLPIWFTNTKWSIKILNKF